MQLPSTGPRAETKQRAGAKSSLLSTPPSYPRRMRSPAAAAPHCRCNPELLCRFVVLAIEVARRWSAEVPPGSSPARSAPPHLRASSTAAWVQRWSGILACAAVRSFLSDVLTEQPTARQSPARAATCPRAAPARRTLHRKQLAWLACACTSYHIIMFHYKTIHVLLGSRFSNCPCFHRGDGDAGKQRSAPCTRRTGSLFVPCSLLVSHRRVVRHPGGRFGVGAALVGPALGVGPAGRRQHGALTSLQTSPWNGTRVASNDCCKLPHSSIMGPGVGEDFLRRHRALGLTGEGTKQ